MKRKMVTHLRWDFAQFPQVTALPPLKEKLQIFHPGVKFHFSHEEEKPVRLVSLSTASALWKNKPAQTYGFPTTFDQDVFRDDAGK